jgi:hypothetical protein
MATVVNIYPDEKTIVKVDATVHFTSLVTGFTLPTYQWYVDGVLQTDKTSSTFDFVPTEVGGYAVTLKVESTGDGDEKESAATIVIAEDNTITDYLAKIAAAV